DPIQPLLPDRVVIPLRSPRDAGGEARLERGGAGRVVAAQADRHHADTGGIDLRPRGEVLVGRGRVPLGLVVERQVPEADGLAVAGAVDEPAGDAARDQVGGARGGPELPRAAEAVPE